MPKVLDLPGKLRVTIYPNDHRPAHVHVLGSGREAVLNLNCPEGPPEVRESFGFSARDIGQILRECEDALASLCSRWTAIHGQV